MARAFFDGPLGRRGVSLTPTEPKGVYMHVFWQGGSHGNEKRLVADAAEWQTPEAHNTIPVLQGLPSWPRAALDRVCGQLISDYGCAAACVEPSAEAYQRLVAKWERNVAEWGGVVPGGKPNSRKWGLHRALGIGHGTFACALRELEGVQQFWDSCIVGFGREPVFRGRQGNVALITFLFLILF